MVDDIGSTPTEVPGQRRLRRFGGLVKRIRNNDTTDGSEGDGRNSQGVFSDAGRHHRRPAELAVRLAPYPAIASGHPLAVSVRMDALHFFDDRGNRIDVGWR